MQLGQKPYQTELDDLVEKEIAAVVLKNKERKKRKGIDGGVAANSAVNKDIEDRLLLIEDCIEKWDEKMDVMGSMLSKLYEAQFGKSAPKPPEEEQKGSPQSEEVQSEDSEDSEESGNDKVSGQSSHDDDSSDGSTSEEDVDNFAEKSVEVRHASQKSKGKGKQEAEGEEEVGSIAGGGVKSGSTVGPSKRGRQSGSTFQKIQKMNVIKHYCCPQPQSV